MLNQSIFQCVSSIQGQLFSASQLMHAIYDRIEKHQPLLNGYSQLLTREKALEKAQHVDDQITAGIPMGRLAGIPVAIKDNICIAEDGFLTTCASEILKNYRSPYNATIVNALLREGAIIIGKTNLDEFAMGSSTENSIFGPSRNPWDPERVAGGSSGGSAVVVASQMAMLSLGSDTGGSIRQPASMCGITGFKPSYGAVSRYGLVAYGSSLDQIGWFTQSAEDASYLLPLLAQHDSHDGTSVSIDWNAQDLPVSLAGLRFCIPREFVEHSVADSDVLNSFFQMVAFLKEQGAVVEEVSLALTEYLIPTYYILAFAEASSNLGRFDGVRYGIRQQDVDSLDSLYRTSRSKGFGTEVKRRILLGTFVLSSGYYDAYYVKACRVRRQIEKHVDQLLQNYDFLLAPVSPFPAFRFGEKKSDPLALYFADIYSVLANLSRTPAISIPSAFSQNQLPIGAQILGRRFADPQLLAVSQLIQQVSSFHQHKPNLA